ncbi:MAG: tetratricopeptide repeat protein, partial [Methanotrichaceae archaeon]
MYNVSPSWILPALDTRLAGIPGGLWTLFGLLLALLSLYFGYPYAKKLSSQNKKDLNQAKQEIIEANARSIAKLERCINERIQISNRGNPTSSFCKEVVEDAKRLQNAGSSYDRGLSKATLGDLDGAEAEFNRAIELQFPILSRYYFQRGNVMSLRKKFKDACLDYSEAIKINPQLTMAWVNKSYTLGQLRKYQDELEAADKAINLDPQLALAWLNKSHGLIKSDNFLDALDAAERTIELDPKLAMAWVNKSNALGRLGKATDALDAADKAI